jgi:hypothetical protein
MKTKRPSTSQEGGFDTKIYPQDSIPACAFVLRSFSTTGKKEDEHIPLRSSFRGDGSPSGSSPRLHLRGKRETHRPMRPKPLIPTLIDMVMFVLFGSFLLVADNRERMTSDGKLWELRTAKNNKCMRLSRRRFEASSACRILSKRKHANIILTCHEALTKSCNITENSCQRHNDVTRYLPVKNN